MGDRDSMSGAVNRRTTGRGGNLRIDVKCSKIFKWKKVKKTIIFF